jgi:hypothetical protein
MDDWKLPWDGGCRCGAVRLRVAAPPLMTMACHCTGCQSMSASAFSMTISVPADGFEVVRGETVIGGLHGPQIRHHHCDRCKAWLFTRVEGMDFFVNLRGSALDEHRWIAPFIETYTAEKLPWAHTGAPHAYATYPDEGDYPALMAAFAEWSAHP